MDDVIRHPVQDQFAHDSDTQSAFDHRCNDIAVLSKVADIGANTTGLKNAAHIPILILTDGNKGILGKAGDWVGLGPGQQMIRGKHRAELFPLEKEGV